MQKWEYLFAVAEVHAAWGEEIWRPRWVNGEELREWKRGPTVQQFANQLGQEGWELVQVGPGGDRGYTIATTAAVGLSPLPMFFKRPLPPSGDQ